MPSPYSLHILHEGYSRADSTGMDANCTCSLITGPTNIIVDTMTPWDKAILTNGLTKHNVNPDDVKLLVSTHGHSDHIGNNNMFLKAKHIVGFNVSYEHKYFDHSFSYGEELVVDDYVKVIATPGHTLTDVTVLVQTDDLGLVAITGDLFEKEEDLTDESIWMVDACSEAPKLQEINRNKILQMVDHIVPGHGPMFKVTKEMKDRVNNIQNEQHYI
ncbi:metallo-beta-lactamase domain-containing protein 1 isoform X2 [Planococcus citri]